MKIIGVKHDGMKNECVNCYLSKLESAAKFRPDLIVGPDYAIYPFNSKGKIDFFKIDFIRNSLAKISLKCPGTHILPGTMPIPVKKNKMFHVSPLWSNGNFINSFAKETDVENSQIARENELIYQRGNNSRNNFHIGNKLIELEICSDHGKQKVSGDTFLEVIQAYDQKAGFYPRAGMDRFPRFAVVNNGFSKDFTGYVFNPNSSKKIFILPQRSLNNFLEEVVLDEKYLS